VYHGVEPGSGPGEVFIGARRSGSDVLVDVTSPFHGLPSGKVGSGMALANIRERLMLFFDLEAALDTEIRDGLYRVRIRLPYRSQA
jgi:two-component system sensor histidine kinase AlgZ